MTRPGAAEPTTAASSGMGEGEDENWRGPYQDMNTMVGGITGQDLKPAVSGMTFDPSTSPHILTIFLYTPTPSA